MDDVIVADLKKIKQEFALPRRTLLEDSKEAVFEEIAPAVVEAVFVMDRFGYCKVMEKSIYERNQESINHDYPYLVHCLTSDKICMFTDLGNLHQIKVLDIPFGKIRDKGIPVDNLSRFDGTKERIIYLSSAEAIKNQRLLFVTSKALVKQVWGAEFETNNRTVVGIKLQDGDKLLFAAPVPERKDADIVLQTQKGVFLRFLVEEIPVGKKISKGVRGIQLQEGEELEAVYLPDEDSIVRYKGRKFT